MNFFFHRLMGATVALFCASSFANEIDFTLFKNCQQLSTLYESVKSASNDFCRPPATLLEKEIDKRRAAKSGFPFGLCFLSQAPSPLPSDFRCYAVVVPTGREIDCFRSANMSAIRDYQEDYPHVYAKPVKSYLQQLASCSVSNGDAESAMFTILPSNLALISRLEFGFTTGLGHDDPANSMVIHGFASLDPSIVGSSSDAIEFVSVATDIPTAQIESRTGEKIGKWSLQVGHLVDIPPRPAVIAGVQTFMTERSVDFEISREPDETTTPERKNTYASTLRTAAASPLSVAGFRPAEEMDPSIASQLDQMKRHVLDQLKTPPVYGFARISDPVAADVDFFSTRRPPCTSNNGVMQAYSVIEKGKATVSSDFGMISVFIVGFGSCATDPAAQEYISNVIKRSEFRLRMKMQELN